MPNRATYSDFVKAQILVLGDHDIPKSTIPVRFNPSEYNLDNSTTYGKQSLPGLTSPISQFVSGDAETLSMELLFDTYDEKADVRAFTFQLDDLLEVDGEGHEPPVCRFVWGTFEFKGVLERVSKRFTMFLENGIPVRARVNVTFREYTTPGEQTLEIPRLSADKTKIREVTEGDTLWLIASKEYGDPEMWRPIAEENGVDNPRALRPGTELVIPPLEP